MKASNSMEAGRALDVKIHEHVMGQDLSTARWCNPPGWYVHPDGRTRNDPPCPRYSTDIEAVWEVVERLRQKWSQRSNAKAGEPDVWVFLDCADEGWIAQVQWLHHDGAIIDVEEQAETLPLAICKAALKAAEQDQAAWDR